MVALNVTGLVLMWNLPMHIRSLESIRGVNNTFLQFIFLPLVSTMLDNSATMGMTLKEEITNAWIAIEYSIFRRNFSSGCW